MNKRTIAIIATVVLCCIFMVIVSIEYKNQKALKADEDNQYQFQQEMTTEEQEETEKPIEIKDNTDDGFSELIPLAPVTQ